MTNATLPNTAEKWTQEAMIRAADGYQESHHSMDESASCFDPALADWQYIDKLDISTLAKRYFDSPQEAQAWLDYEIKIFEDDGMTWRADDFRSMLRDGIQDALIIGNSAQDGMALWDGLHRLAAAFIAGYTVPAIVGMRR